MQEIIKQINSFGLNCGNFPFDGKIHRFNVDSKDQKKSGWALGYQNHTLHSGELFHVAVCGNFRTGESFTVQSDSVALTREDRENIKKQINKAKKLEKKLREENQEKVSVELAEKWNALENIGSSEYLKRKQISAVPNLGVKYDGKGSMYIPAKDADGKIWSWQKIQWDGGKWFYSGGRIDGCFHIIGNPDKSKTIYICEGFATGASVYTATGKAVVVTFTANNMLKIAKLINKKYTKAKLVICGDNDLWSKKPDGTLFNSGRIKAEETAKKLFTSAVFPEFKNIESKPTDFNDLHILEGIAAVEKQIMKIKPPQKMAVYALGFREGEYFFTSTVNKTISSVTAFTEDNFLKLMPLVYWENEFPAVSERSRVDWTEAKNALISMCHKRGIFNGGLVRGSGAWSDEGRIILNMGTHLIVDGDRVELGQIKSRHFYTLADNQQPIHANPLSVDECRTLVNACNGFKWTHGKDSGTLLAGILVLSRICGALPVRPHAWITGSAQTGKTTLLERLVYPILGDNAFYAHSGTTEAGLRQSLGANAFPVLFDEFETNGKKTDEHIASCIELMRASWSSSGASIYKGGANGNANHYQARFSAIVSSIRTCLTNDADKGRFAILELAPHGSDESHWENLSKLLCEIDDEYSSRLYARTINMIPTILESYKVIKKAFSRRSGARFGDQYGMILAGFSSLIWDEILTLEDAEFIVDEMDFTEEKEESNVSDHGDALNHLLTKKIVFDSVNFRRSESLVGRLITDVLKESPFVTRVKGSGYNTYSYDQHTGPTQNERIAALQNIGIVVSSKFDYVAVASKHAELARLWSGTKWASNWATPLLRIEGAARSTVRVNKEPKTSIKIPAKYFVD